MKKILWSICAVCSLFFISCGKYDGFGSDNIFYSGNYVQKRSTSLLTLDEETKNLPSEYDFVVITDLHIGVKRQDAPLLPDNQFIEWLSELPPEQRPAFCLCLGDVADCGYEEQYVQFAELVSKIESLGVKVYNTVGNHDLYQSGWDFWKDTCYPHCSFYKFNTSGYSFYSIDTGTGMIGSDQMKALKCALEEDPLPKIIFTHYPLYTDTFFFNFDDTPGRNLLMHYFAENNVKLYLAGHLHWLEKHEFGSYESYALPSYRYKGQWTVVHVNEKNETYEISVISKKN